MTISTHVPLCWIRKDKSTYFVSVSSSHCVCQSISILTVSANTTFRILYFQLSYTTIYFGPFLAISVTFYNNMHGKEYRGGGMSFAVLMAKIGRNM
jgi:hypothetical protein